jgi:hypothetical protein
VFWGGCGGALAAWSGGEVATDNTVEAVDGVVRRTTQGSWAMAFGDMQWCFGGKGIGAMGGVVGGRHALVGRDKQQSTKGERERGQAADTLAHAARSRPRAKMGGAEALD